MMRAKRIAMRRDVEIIRDAAIPARWTVHFRAEYTAPPLPHDLLDDYSVSSNWIKSFFNGSPSFTKAFDRDPVALAAMGWWLDYPPVGDSTFESFLENYTSQDAIDAIDGWNLRFILNTCSGRWKNARCKGKKQRAYLVKVAIELTSRMRLVLEELSEIDEWIKIHQKDKSIPKTIAIAQRFRYWRYQELTFLRYEQWWRCHRSLTEVYTRYHEKQMEWQACWFELTQPGEVLTRIQEHLTHEHVDPFIRDGDDNVENGDMSLEESTANREGSPDVAENGNGSSSSSSSSSDDDCQS
jgi:hypothetical protein